MTTLKAFASSWMSWLFAGALVMACGGGGVEENGTGNAPDTLAVGTVESKASVSALRLALNAPDYDLSQARFEDGLGRPLTEADVEEGMWVEIRGTKLADRVAVQTVRVRPSNLGTVTFSAGSSVQVDGVPVRSYAQTTVRPGPRAVVGDFVEVHGRLALGNQLVEASRIEVVPRPALFERRGIVESVDEATKTAVISGRSVSYANVTFAVGASAGGGSVAGSGSSSAGAVGNAASSAASGSSTGSISDNGTTVTVTGSTSVGASASATSGAAAASNVRPIVGQSVRVAADTAPPPDPTPWSVTRIVADQMLPPRGAPTAYVQGIVSDFKSAANGGPTFTLEGVPVDARSAVFGSADIGNAACVVVFGELDANGTLIAKSVSRLVLGPPGY